MLTLNSQSLLELAEKLAIEKNIGLLDKLMEHGRCIHVNVREKCCAHADSPMWKARA